MFWIRPVEVANKASRFPIATWTIICINCLVFYYLVPHPLEGSVGADLAGTYGFVPARAKWWMLFSSVFLHKDLAHLAGNMFFLWFVGDNVEEVTGVVLFVLLYALCGLTDLLLVYLLIPHSTVMIIGASAAISGLIGIYYCFFPWVKVEFELWLGVWDTGYKLTVSTATLVPFWILLQFALPFVGPSATFYWGHVIGALTGVILGKLLVRLGLVDLFWRDLEQAHG